ncbi:hypothetical protein WA026_001310 [Henosepilachna vigintioctopunctata]|uniref:Uncharacterized protein n=1 Tax=Henosepilachna vigintioctopunctata TaxID=420089 RepID=A0AAW1UTG0_9CUCU
MPTEGPNQQVINFRNLPFFKSTHPANKQNNRPRIISRFTIKRDNINYKPTPYASKEKRQRKKKRTLNCEHNTTIHLAILQHPRTPHELVERQRQKTSTVIRSRETEGHEALRIARSTPRAIRKEVHVPSTRPSISFFRQKLEEKRIGHVLSGRPYPAAILLVQSLPCSCFITMKQMTEFLRKQNSSHGFQRRAGGHILMSLIKSEVEKGEDDQAACGMLEIFFVVDIQYITVKQNRKWDSGIVEIIL